MRGGGHRGGSIRRCTRGAVDGQKRSRRRGVEGNASTPPPPPTPKISTSFLPLGREKKKTTTTTTTFSMYVLGGWSHSQIATHVRRRGWLEGRLRLVALYRCRRHFVRPTSPKCVCVCATPRPRPLSLPHARMASKSLGRLAGLYN